MKCFKAYQHQMILLKDNTVADGDFILDEGLTVRIKEGLLNDVVLDSGEVLPAIETANSSHVEHWVNGVLHCETGPAVIDSIDKYEQWWLDGIEVKKD